MHGATIRRIVYAKLLLWNKKLHFYPYFTDLDRNIVKMCTKNCKDVCQKSQSNYFCVFSFFFSFVNILYSDTGFLYFAIYLRCNTPVSSVPFPNKLPISVAVLLLLLLLLHCDANSAN